MTAKYILSCIPLDSQAASAAPNEFTVHVVCQLEFAAGAVTAGQIAQAIAEHPLLKAGPGAAIPALARPFSQWRLDRTLTAANAQRVSLHHSGDRDFGAMAETLRAYLASSGDRASAGVAHDAAYDKLARAQFVEIGRLHDRCSELTRQFLGEAPVNAAEATVESLSVAALQQFGAAARAMLIQAVTHPGHPMVAAALTAKRLDSSKLDELSKGLSKLRRRLQPQAGLQSQQALADGAIAQVHGAAGLVSVQADDPNLAIHAAMKNELLARACGFVTTWTCRSPQPLAGDFVLQLDLAGLPSNGSIVSLSTLPTACRRREHTHPLAFADIDQAATGNAGLAALNDANGPRYHASSVNAESALVKELLVQAGNSMANAAPSGDARDQAPQLLAGQQFGLAEPETSGVTFSAPVQDLAADPQGASVQQRQAAYPCCFLDDLWIGYRLDLADAAASAYRSVHEQQQRIVFRGGGEVRGSTEDYYEREQAGDPAQQYISTEFATYNGMSSAQARDYHLFLEGAKEADSGGGPFELSITGYGNATRLLFGNVYHYRLRNVFVGGVSLRSGDGRLPALGAHTTQRFPFYRTRAYLPGDFVPAAKDEYASRQGDTATIFLSSERPSATVTLVPSPIDVETSRYLGLLLAHEKEAWRYRGRQYVADAGKFFSEHKGQASYFLDPAVSAVIVRVKLMNGSSDRSQANFAFEEGTYCEIVRHLALPPLRQQYGKAGDWESFRPISITFRTTEALDPHIGHKGWTDDRHHIEILVPAAAELEISILPDVKPAELRRTASFAASSRALYEAEKNAVAATEGWLPVPALGERRLRVIHAVRRPLRQPVLVGVSGASASSGLTKALRGLDSSTAEIPAYVEVDAASTGQLRLEASWYDIDDNPALPKFLVNQGRSVTAAHSVVFRPGPGAEEPMALAQKLGSGKSTQQMIGAAAYSFEDLFELQLAENKVFLGAAPAVPDAGPAARWHALDLRDGRRKIASVSAEAHSRYADQFGDRAAARRSAPLLVDVPSTVRLSAPRISHALPIMRQVQRREGATQSVQQETAIRIYFHAPGFESGPGERFAIACRAGDEPAGPQRALDKLATQWGEDPLERPGLALSRRPPRAADFTVPQTDRERPDPDEQLYPRTGPDAQAWVLYRDNILVPADGPELPARRLSVASFALQPAQEERLWYIDVAISGEFSGWCGLALYRHQPHACEGRELSLNADWVYAGFIHGDPVAWTARHRQLHVTVGPVYDPYASFEADTLEFRHGVSENLSSNESTVVELQRYQVGRAYYFEAVLASTRTTWSLTKKRFGYGIASITLGDGSD